MPEFSLRFHKTQHTMAIMKVIEVMASSTKSWEDATKNAVERTAKSVRDIKSAFVQSQSVVVENNKVSEYRVNVKITFEVN
jgi:flavin-binding protein dodecin